MELRPIIDCLPILAILGVPVAIGLLQIARKHRPKNVTHEKISTVNLSPTGRK